MTSPCRKFSVGTPASAGQQDVVSATERETLVAPSPSFGPAEAGVPAGPPTPARLRAAPGFTLLEVVIVIAIFVSAALVVSLTAGSLNRSREEGYLRNLAETIEFLHRQSVADQAVYRLNIYLRPAEGQPKQGYAVGVIRPEEATLTSGVIDPSSGTLSLELAAALSPPGGSSATLIPPPSFPSLAKVRPVPAEFRFTRIRTFRGVHTPESDAEASILFSPRGFSEFAVLQVELTNRAPATLLINPFTGKVTIYREHKDFEWQRAEGGSVG